MQWPSSTSWSPREGSTTRWATFLFATRTMAPPFVPLTGVFLVRPFLVFPQRWGDAPVHSLGVGLFAPKDSIKFFVSAISSLLAGSLDNERADLLSLASLSSQQSDIVSVKRSKSPSSFRLLTLFFASTLAGLLPWVSFSSPFYLSRPPSLTFPSLPPSFSLRSPYSHCPVGEAHKVGRCSCKEEDNFDSVSLHFFFLSRRSARTYAEISTSLRQKHWFSCTSKWKKIFPGQSWFGSP